MPWLLIDGRDRGQFVRGAEKGAPLYTREPERAMHFDKQAQARHWLATHCCSLFGGVALMRVGTTDDRRQNRVGKAGHYGPRAKN